MKYVHIQDIVGRRVRDENGKILGRLHAIKAEIHGKDCVVTEYHLGPAALLERLGMKASALFGIRMNREPLKIAWDELDLTNSKDLRVRR
jgi:sporulation protein YlmC with PRC-barrel domain